MSVTGSDQGYCCELWTIMSVTGSDQGYRCELHGGSHWNYAYSPFKKMVFFMNYWYKLIKKIPFKIKKLIMDYSKYLIIDETSKYL
jgi:hypothetical protein